MSKNFQEKIDRLKKVFAKNPNELEQTVNWEESMSKLVVAEEWLKHPMTMALAEIARGEIARIQTILADTEELSDADRKGLFAEKKAHFIYLAALDIDPSSEKEVIEKQVTELNHEIDSL